MGKIIAVTNQKGGVGKTTTCVNLAASLAATKRRVLLIDLDPQANLSQSLGLPDEPEPNLYHVLRQEAMGQTANLESIIMTAHGLDIAPASLELASAELELVSVYGREQVLSTLIRRLKTDYDFVLIDCPPSISMLTVNALVASDFILMPLQAEFLPLKGVKSFLRHLNMVMRLNPKIDLLGFVLTKFDARKKMSQSVLERLEIDYPGKVFRTRIRSNIALANAQERGQDIFTFDRNSNGALDHLWLAQEFLEKLELP